MCFHLIKIVITVNHTGCLLINTHLNLRNNMMTWSNGNIFRVTGHFVGNSPVPGELPAQRPVTRSFDVFLDLRLNKRLSKQWWGWWFETLSDPLWRHRNDLLKLFSYIYIYKHSKTCCMFYYTPMGGIRHSWLGDQHNQRWPSMLRAFKLFSLVMYYSPSQKMC